MVRGFTSRNAEGSPPSFLANRRIANATIVGASAGGGLALDFALQSPASVQRLVLLGAVVDGLGYSDHFLQRERANAAPLARGDAEAAIANQVGDRFVLVPGHDSARHRLSDILLANPQNLRKRGDLELPSAKPAVARLGEVQAPTLILVGEFDIPDVQAHAGAIELGIWGARREVVRDAGHLIQLDQPAVLRDRVIGANRRAFDDALFVRGRILRVLRILQIIPDQSQVQATSTFIEWPFR